MEEVKDDKGNVIGYKEADDYENKWFIGHDTEQIWDYERDGVWQLGEGSFDKPRFRTFVECQFD